MVDLISIILLLIKRERRKKKIIYKKKEDSTSHHWLGNRVDQDVIHQIKVKTGICQSHNYLSNFSFSSM